MKISIPWSPGRRLHLLTPRLRGLLVSLFLLAGLSACVSLDPQPSFQRVADEVEARSGQPIQWTVDEGDRQAALKLLDEELTLESAVRLALLGSPALQAEYQKLGIAQAAFVQAGLLSNPVFDIAYREGQGQNTLDLGLSIDFLQVFLIPVRKRQAAAGQREAELAVTRAVLSRVGEVRQAWIGAVAAGQTEASLAESHALMQSLDGVSEALWQAGNISALESKIAQRMYLENRVLLEEARADSETARDRLDVTIGAWGRPNWTLAAVLPRTPESEPTATDGENVAVVRSLELALARARIERSAADLDLGDRSRLIPSLEAGWTAEREDGAWSDGPAIAFALPVLDTGRAANAAYRAELEHYRREYLQLEIELRATARRMQRERALRRSMVDHIRESVLPVSAALVEESKAHYLAAHVGIADVLKARVEHNRAQRDYVEALARYWQAREAQSALMQGVRLAQRGPEGAPANPGTRLVMGEH
jgi:cobalt-zinc-cadmium efflux system outer membrane protein